MPLACGINPSASFALMVYNTTYVSKWHLCNFTPSMQRWRTGHSTKWHVKRPQHLILYWCPQTFPLPWQTSWSRLQQQDTLQMSTSWRTGKHRMCSSNSVGRSVSLFVRGSWEMPFTSGCPSPATDVAIFTVYPITSCPSPAPLWRRGRGVGKGGRVALHLHWLLGQKGGERCATFTNIGFITASRFKRHTFVNGSFLSVWKKAYQISIIFWWVHDKLKKIFGKSCNKRQSKRHNKFKIVTTFHYKCLKLQPTLLKSSEIHVKYNFYVVWLSTFIRQLLFFNVLYIFYLHSQQCKTVS